MDTTTREPTTVGSMLKEEFLIPMGITQQQLAQTMGVDRRTVSLLINGKRRLTIDDAIMLADLFEMNVEFWLDLQATHDRWEARQRHDRTHKLPPIMHILGRVSHA